jgi:hypothetical protein
MARNVNFLGSAVDNPTRPRNGFDLSREDLFTKPAGLITPIFFQQCYGGEYYDIDVKNLTRTFTLNTAAFTAMREKVNYFFVPVRYIWKWYNEFISDTTNTDSSVNPNGVNSISTLPYVTGSQIAKILNDADPLNTQTDIFGYSTGLTLLRILDMFRYPISNTDNHSQSRLTDTIAMYNGADMVNRQFNVFPLYAFMRIYHDYYRNSQYEGNTPIWYNLDKYAAGANISDADFRQLTAAVAVLYANLPKDFFTGCVPQVLQPTTQVPQFPALGFDSSSIVNFNSDKSFTAIYKGDNGYNPVSLTQMAVDSLRAVNKIALISQLAGKTYQEQMRAHWGVNPQDVHQAKFIGQHSSNIEIAPVVATAAGSTGSSSSKLGQIAASAVGSANGHISFQCPEEGFIIGCHHVEYNVVYRNDSIDRMHTKLARNDMYIPEFDNLGLQPLTRAEVTSITGQLADIDDVIGYHARYSEYKTSKSVAHGQFSNGNLSAWAAVFNPDQSLGVLRPSTYKFNPKVLQNIFSIIYSGQDYSDQFMHVYHHQVHAVRDMSVHGLPIL